MTSAEKIIRPRVPVGADTGMLHFLQSTFSAEINNEVIVKKDFVVMFKNEVIASVLPV